MIETQATLSNMHLHRRHALLTFAPSTKSRKEPLRRSCCNRWQQNQERPLVSELHFHSTDFFRLSVQPGEGGMVEKALLAPVPVNVVCEISEVHPKPISALFAIGDKLDYLA